MRVVWRPLLLAICTITAFLTVVNIVGQTGMRGEPPWFGIWGATFGASPRALTLTVLSVDPGGPSGSAGLRRGDLVDVSKNSLVERFSVLGQPLAGRAITIAVQRGEALLHLTIVPQPLDLRKRWDVLVSEVGTLLLLAFAGIIAARRSHVREMRILALTLAFYATGFVTNPGWYAAPVAWIYVFYSCFGMLWPLSIALWVRYCVRFALPLSPERKIAQLVCFGFVAVALVVRASATLGILTLWLRPVFLNSSLAATLPLDGAILAAIVSSILAIAESRDVDRQRAAWSIVPLATMVAIEQLTRVATAVPSTYADFVFWAAVGNVTVLMAPVVLTYAALSRRLLDIGFVLNRAVIFGIVSIFVIGSFLIIEWAFSEWFVETNHITGNLASMAVALGLGFSMRFVHEYVDRFVDQIFFRKRHEDEAALRRFAIEATYTTDRDVLLARTVKEIKEHTDAIDVSICVSNSEHSFAHAGEAGLLTMPVDENDEAIVAMRTWRKRVDLAEMHDSALQGEFAFPMIARGTLVGFIVCGAKPDGEVYAPDELDALMAIAQGVGAALIALEGVKSSVSEEILAEIAAIRGEVQRLSRAPSATA